MNILVKSHRVIPDPETGETIEITVKMKDNDTGRVATLGINPSDWGKSIEEQCNNAMTAFETLLSEEANAPEPVAEVVEVPKFTPVETVFE